ncbi:unnamed protein product [Urochloa humidicola]
MSYGDDAICIFPSSILAGVCMEANFSEPGYVECSEKRYTFQFTVDVKANTADTSGNCMDFKSTGFPFREKADAIESAALAALEFLLHHYGVSCELYNDSVFIQHWPLYDHLSEHREESRVNVSGLIDEIVSLATSFERSFKLFEDAKLLFDTNYEHATDVSILDNCLNELHNIHGSLVADIKPCIEVQRLCLLNRRDNRNCHEAMLRQQNETDVKMRCSSALKLTLDRVCNRACYSVASIRCCCVSEKSYAAEVSLVDESGSAAQSKHVKILKGAHNKSCLFLKVLKGATFLRFLREQHS